MNHPERDPDPLAQLLRDATALDERERLAARGAFLRRVDREASKSSGMHGRKLWLAPLATAAAALLVVLAWPSRRLEFEVEGALSEGGYVRARGSAPATVRFSDETRLTAMPGSRLRIGETQRSGASVSIEQGHVEAHVFHAGDSDWRFVAGPFQVRVTGTRFDLIWDAPTERLEVVLHEGSVEIAGYAGSGPVAVRAGQRFVGDARERTMQVTDRRVAEREQTSPPNEETVEDAIGDVIEVAAEVTAAEDGVTSDASNLPPAGLPGKNAPRAGSKGASSWTELIAQGEFHLIVREAEARGTSSCLARCALADLVALADAARYRGRSDLAEQALLALRKRFPSEAGTRAAFLLGRLYEHQGQQAKARTWYETSLRESPGGSFAAESLAGKMRTVNALEGKVKAGVIAREYLHRYPRGVHASQARQLAGSP